MSSTGVLSCRIDDLAAMNVAIGKLCGAGQFVYRGQSDASWTIASSFERTADLAEVEPDLRRAPERTMVAEFMRMAHLLIDCLPVAAPDSLEWLSWIQHYGGPTRLVDVTVSPYVAAFFACSGARTHAAVWCIDGSGLPVCPRGLDGFSDEGPALYRYAPHFANERLHRQRGEFLVPANCRDSFESLLCLQFGVASAELDAERRMRPAELPTPSQLVPRTDARIIRLVIPAASVLQMIRDLDLMNINAATLFPGLQGFCSALSLHLVRARLPFPSG